MKWTLDHSFLPVYLRVAIQGKSTAAANRALWEALLSHEDWRPGTSILFDVTGMEQLGDSANEITEASITYFVENKERIGPSCIAVVRGHNEINGYSNRFQYALRLRGSSVVVRNFADETSAVEWLAHISKTESS